MIPGEAPPAESEPLAQKAAEAPAAPGIYLLRDGEGRILYVGKAARLRDRLAAYFRAGGPEIGRAHV